MSLLRPRSRDSVAAARGALWRELRELPRGAWVLAGGSFINSFGVLVLPFLTLYLVRRGYTASDAGAAVLLYGLGKLVAAPCGGYLADRVGPRGATSISMFGSAGSMLALWSAGGLPMTLVLAGITGLTSELYRPSTTALLSGIVDHERRVTAFGLYALGTNAGVAAGPAIGGLLAEHWLGALFVIDAITSSVWGALALRALPEPRRPPRRPAARGAAIRAIAGNRALIRFLVASTLANVVLFQAQTSLPLWIRELGLSSAVYGALLATNGILNATLQLPLAAISKRFSPRAVIAAGCTLIGAGFALTGLVHSVLPLFAVVVIWTLGEVISWPVGAAYVASLAPDGLAGRYAGARSFSYALALVLAAPIGITLLTWKPIALWSFCLITGSLAVALILHSPATDPSRAPPIGARQPPTSSPSTRTVTSPS